MAYQSGPIMNPQVPYIGSISGGCTAGKMIFIQGVPTGSEGFNINLALGGSLNPRSDTALHFNARFSQNEVVRNTLSGGSWGSEEKQGGMPFYIGQPFEVIILVQNDCYRVAVNGNHFVEYRHRIAKESVQYLAIGGAIRLTLIRFEGGSYAPPAGQYAPPAGGVTFTTETNINNPPVPFQTPLGGIYPGKTIVVKGIPRPGGSRFHVNFQCGSYGDPDIALTFDVRFNYGADQNKVVRNHKQGGQWGSEEKSQSYFPFMHGVPFEMTILVESYCFRISVNNSPFTEFNHRIQPIQRVDFLEIGDDVNLTNVRIK